MGGLAARPAKGRGAAPLQRSSRATCGGMSGYRWRCGGICMSAIFFAGRSAGFRAADRPWRPLAWQPPPACSASADAPANGQRRLVDVQRGSIFKKNTRLAGLTKLSFFDCNIQYGYLGTRLGTIIIKSIVYCPINRTQVPIIGTTAVPGSYYYSYYYIYSTLLIVLK